jgi:hypothetical protein
MVELLNNCMTENNQKVPRYKEKSPSRGGARAGAGRPKGAKDRVTVSGILEALDTKTGRNYEEILIEDFIKARLDGDTQLVHKYHTLLSNKFVANLNDIVVENIGDLTSDKESAFLAALNSLNNINKTKDNEDAPD